MNEFLKSLWALVWSPIIMMLGILFLIAMVFGFGRQETIDIIRAIHKEAKNYDKRKSTLREMQQDS